MKAGVMVTITFVCTLCMAASAWTLNRNINAFAAEIGVETSHLIGRR